MIEVRREDGALCGYIRRRGERWQALTIFGSVLAETTDDLAARNVVLARGLASLGERWELRARCEDTWQVVCIQEASPRRVRVALGYHSLPGVPTREISVDELLAGEFELRPR